MNNHPDVEPDEPWTWRERALGVLMAAVAFVVLVIFCVGLVAVGYWLAS